MRLVICLLMLCVIALFGSLLDISSAVAAQQSQTMSLAIADSTTGFRVMSAAGGSNTTECSAPGADPSWVVDQWNNEQSLCSGAVTNPSACPDAVWVRATATMSDCYWQQTKKMQLAINTDAMSYNGCYLNRDQAHQQNPGGYSDYIATDTTQRSDFFTSTFPSLGQISALTIDSAASTDYFAKSSCPSGVTDPVYGSTPYAFTYMSIIVTQILPGTKNGGNVLFYQVYLYDNRTLAPSYKNCTLPSSSSPNGVAVIGEPATVFGQPMAQVGVGPHDYSMNVLPRLETALTSCFGSNADLGQYKISGAYFGIEAANTALLTMTVQNPHLTIAYNMPVASGGSPAQPLAPAPTRSQPSPSQAAPEATISASELSIRLLSQTTKLPLANAKVKLQIKYSQGTQYYDSTTDKTAILLTPLCQQAQA